MLMNSTLYPQVRQALRPGSFFNLGRFFLLGLVLLTSLACGKSAETIDPNLQSPPPTGVGGKWSYGTFSPTSFWGTNGSYSGAAYEQAVAFQFSDNGTYEMYVMNVTNYYGCRTGSYTYFKGKAKFNEANQSIVLTPTQGTQRGEYSCASGKNFKRDATNSEITEARRTLRYEQQTNAKGQPVLHVYLSDADQQGVSMTPGNW